LIVASNTRWSLSDACPARHPEKRHGISDIIALQQTTPAFAGTSNETPMADYFTHFSFVLPLPTEAAQQYAIELAEQASYAHLGDESLPDDFPASLREVIEDWRFETVVSHPSEGWGLWLHSSSGGIDAVCAFIQHLLQRFNATGEVAFEWSHDCSKPRTDAYGGGAALITARKIKTFNTAEWLNRQVARRSAKKPMPELLPAAQPKGETP
jgi:hypothetical protein